MQKSVFSHARIGAAAAGVAFAALLMAGCHDDAPTATPPTVVATPPSTTVVTPPVAATPPGTTTVTTTPDTKINTNAGPGTSNGTDTALADKVNTAIVHNKQMTGSRVDPVATAGVVTLTGQVQNGQQKALAETTARNVPGVTGVKNKLLIVSTGGAKPKPIVVTKTKTIIVHDHSAPASSSDTGSADSGQTPDATAAPAAPAAPETPNTPNSSSGNP